VTGTTRPAASARRADDPDQDRRLAAYIARHPGTEFSRVQGGQPGVQVTAGGCRIIIHYSLTRLLDDLEDAERATIGTIGRAAENSGGAR
jgi:hypothetical protein